MAKTYRPDGISREDVGRIFKKSDGSLWRMISWCDLPTFTMHCVDKDGHHQEREVETFSTGQMTGVEREYTPLYTKGELQEGEGNG